MPGLESTLRWLLPWEPSLTFVLAFGIAVIIYTRGAMRLSLPVRRQLLFFAGMALIYIALHTRLDYYFERQFFLHRLQHLLLHHLGPFLIALSYPGPAFQKGLPFALRQFLHTHISRAWPFRWLIAFFMHPLCAVVLFVGIIYFWLAASLHFLAMLDWRLYRVMNWSVTLDGILFWCLVLDPRPAPRARLSSGMRILLILLAAPPQIILGACIFFSTHDLYPIYALCGRALSSVDAQRDQQLGGLILWIPGAMMSFTGALVALRYHLRNNTRQSKWPCRFRRGAYRDEESRLRGTVH